MLKFLNSIGLLFVFGNVVMFMVLVFVLVLRIKGFLKVLVKVVLLRLGIL